MECIKRINKVINIKIALVVVVNVCFEIIFYERENLILFHEMKRVLLRISN